ncbi:fluoride efflux transporter FluC [Longispora urticae]
MNWRTLSVIAAGGTLGALTRHALATAWPDLWGILAVNITGCLLIGVLLARWPRHRLFLGVGYLGGYTTFSTYILEAQQLLDAHRPGMALLYLTVTPVAALAAVTLGTLLGRRA